MKLWCNVAVAAAAFAVVVAGSPMAGAGQEASGTTSEGVYSEEQSDRGKELFNWACSECHLPNEFKGIVDDWEGSSIYDVFESIRTTMPEDGPGSLRNQEYTDVVAYILDLNGVPAGTAELPADGDAQRSIRVEGPPEGRR